MPTPFSPYEINDWKQRVSQAKSKDLQKLAKEFTTQYGFQDPGRNVTRDNFMNYLNGLSVSAFSESSPEVSLEAAVLNKNQAQRELLNRASQYGINPGSTGVSRSQYSNLANDAGWSTQDSRLYKARTAQAEILKKLNPQMSYDEIRDLSNNMSGTTFGNGDNYISLGELRRLRKTAGLSKSDLRNATAERYGAEFLENTAEAQNFAEQSNIYNQLVSNLNPTAAQSEQPVETEPPLSKVPSVNHNLNFGDEHASFLNSGYGRDFTTLWNGLTDEQKGVFDTNGDGLDWNEFTSMITGGGENKGQFGRLSYNQLQSTLKNNNLALDNNQLSNFGKIARYQTPQTPTAKAVATTKAVSTVTPKVVSAPSTPVVSKASSTTSKTPAVAPKAAQPTQPTPATPPAIQKVNTTQLPTLSASNNYPSKQSTKRVAKYNLSSRPSSLAKYGGSWKWVNDGGNTYIRWDPTGFGDYLIDPYTGKVYYKNALRTTGNSNSYRGSEITRKTIPDGRGHLVDLFDFLDVKKNGGEISKHRQGNKMEQDIQIVATIIKMMMQQQNQQITDQDAVAKAQQLKKEQPDVFAQVLQEGSQMMQQQQAQMKRKGGQLNYLRTLRNQCPEGYETEYFKAGGAICSKCRKKAEKKKGGSIEKPKTAVAAFKAKCGSKIKK